VTIAVELSRLDVPATLAASWLDLEARADISFFQSWLWVGAWLAATGARPLVARVFAGGELVGLGLLSENRTRRHRILPVRQLVLTETGRPESDRLAIEYNGFVLARDAPDDTLALLLRALDGDWQELVLGGVPERYAAIAEAAGLRVEIDRRNACYAVDLAALRSSGRSWLQSLSANSRAQIRQATRYAAQAGPLAIEAAGTAAEAHGFLDALIALHQTRWRGRGEPGAFGTLFERNFHHHLINTGFEAGQIQLVRISAGERVLGYLYNFLHRRQVMNYQGGFRYGDDNRDRPGLVAHALCVGMANEAGFDRYDFMAGDSRYKRSLGQCDETLIWCRAQRPRLAFSVERAARCVKRLLTRGRSGAHGE
jgi:CelD/BcsL family acetyltransferase involved in cellulose biosynthesis